MTRDTMTNEGSDDKDTMTSEGCADLDAHESIPRHWDGTIPDDVMEVYSPPRLVPEAVRRGLRAVMSVDLTLGYDLCDHEVRRQTLAEVRARRPRALGLSCPCTMYSELNRLWNEKKTSKEVWEARMKEANIHLDFSMALAKDRSSRLC